MKMSKFRIAVLVLLAVAGLAIALISTVSTVYTSEQIPSSYFIKVNYTEQETWFYCGPACVQMGLSYWSIFVNQTELAEEMGTSEELNVTLEDDMTIPFNKRNIEVHTEHLNIDKLKVHISHGEPVIILIFFDLDLTEGHYVVVIGYTEDVIYVHDPWPTSWGQPVGRQSGGERFNFKFDARNAEGMRRRILGSCYILPSSMFETVVCYSFSIIWSSGYCRNSGVH